ncbi:MAG: CARDB domain-containing protein, partial [Flavobacteriales bacterium]
MRKILLSVFICVSGNVYCQNYLLPQTGSATWYISSPVTVLDPGGTNNYPNSCNSTTHLHAAISGEKVKITFSTFSMMSGDYVRVYDGPSTSYTQLGQYTSSSPGIICATSTSGSLTIVFNSNGSNNTSGFVMMAETLPSFPDPDYSFTSCGLTLTTVPAGAIVTTNSTLVNMGSGPALLSHVAYLISTDTLFDISDVYLDLSSTFDVINPNNTVAHSKLITIPASTAPGNYHILCVADFSSTVPEASETNNVTHTPIAIVAAVKDLGFSFATSSVQLYQGQSKNVSWTVKNYGNVNTGISSELRVYLSSDTIPENTEQIALPLTVGSLAAQGVSNNNITFIAPWMAPGNYFILIEADVQDTIQESNENNNVRIIPATLNISNIELRTVPVVSAITATPGDGFILDAKIYNDGSVDLNGSNLVMVACYLSSDTTLDVNDALVGSYVNFWSITPGTFNTASFTLNFPASVLTAGYSYLLIKSDDAGIISEANETNNVGHVALTLLPPTTDFYTTNFTHPSIVTQLYTYNLSFVAYNSGNLNTVGVTATVYFSADTIIDPSDFASVSLTFGVGGGSNPVNISFNAGPTPGSQYIILKIDTDESYSEINETNNIIVHPVTVQSIPIMTSMGDLDPLSVTTPVSAIQTVNFSLSAIIKNNGPAGMASSEVSYYLSTDTIYDSGTDLLILTTIANSIANGATTNVNGTTSVGLSTLPGNYYVIAISDPQHLL